MNFLDNMVKSSNALLKDKLQNPFGNSKESSSTQQPTPTNNPNSTQYHEENQDDQSRLTNQTESAPSHSEPSGSQQNRPSVSSSGDTNSQFASIAADAEAVTKKAVDGAKNIGTFLFSMANKAGRHVNEAANKVKKVVETNIMTDFTKDQQEFIKEHGGNIQPSASPWTCYDDEIKANEMREQIISLSQDKRNFVRGPPNDSDFVYDPDTCLPTALSLLKEDPNLGKMRYELVPKFVNEDTFWRNYFYRVSLLKRFIDKGDSEAKHDWRSSRSSSGEGPDEITMNDDSMNQTYTNTRDGHNVEGIEVASSHQQLESQENTQIISPFDNSNLITQQTSELDDSSKVLAEADDLNTKLKELNIGFEYDGTQDDIDNWDEELEKDLQEFELISKNDLNNLDDEESLDKEIEELKDGKL